jgi:hypothetical protein
VGGIGILAVCVLQMWFPEVLGSLLKYGRITSRIKWISRALINCEALSKHLPKSTVGGMVELEFGLNLTFRFDNSATAAISGNCPECWYVARYVFFFLKARTLWSSDDGHGFWATLTQSDPLIEPRCVPIW